MYYPKQSKNELYQVTDPGAPYNELQLTYSQRLTKQLKDLDIPFTEDFETALKHADHVVDAIFGTIGSSVPLFPL